MDLKSELQILQLTTGITASEYIRNINVAPRGCSTHIVLEISGSREIGIEDQDGQNVVRIGTSFSQRNVYADAEAVLSSQDHAIDILIEDGRSLTSIWGGCLLPFESALGIVAYGELVERDWTFVGRYYFPRRYKATTFEVAIED